MSMPARDRELRHRIDVRHVDPVRAAIERHAECRRVGDAAPADAVARLDQRKSPLAGGDAARRGDAGRARADDHHIDIAGRRNRAKRRRRHGSGRSGQKGAAAERHERFKDVRTRQIASKTWPGANHS